MLSVSFGDPQAVEEIKRIIDNYLQNMPDPVPLDNQLDQFKLSLGHGDGPENDLWPLVGTEFANYEMFWRRFIIPCTNRVVPGAEASHKIRLRAEARPFEEMVISHYSTFFYFAHGTRFLKNNQHDLLANIVFVLLHTSIENLEIFLKRTEQIHYETSGRRVRFGQPKNDNKFVQEITDYRNVLAHKPVVGRAVDQGVEKLPILSALEHVKMSWLDVECLRDEEFCETKDLVEELRAGYGNYLNDKWAEVLTSMEKIRLRFLDKLRVPDNDIMIGSTTQPIAPSGSIHIGHARSDTIQKPQTKKL